MITIPTTRGASALVERRCRTYGPQSEAAVLAELDRRYGMTPDRAEAAVRLALVRGRLVRRTGDDGDAVLSLPIDWRNA